MTAPSSPSTTSDLEAARHLIGLGEGFGTGRAARRLQGERATARRQWDDAEAALRTALSTAQEIGSPAPALEDARGIHAVVCRSG
jgi:hypothetical protein